MVAKSFKFMVLRLLAKSFVNQKVESVHFYSCPQAKLSPRFSSLPPRQKEITHSSQTAFSKNLFFPSRKKGGENYRAEKMKKIRNSNHFYFR